MNEGMISTRYAKAIYEYACDNKVEDQVYTDMKRIAHTYKNEPKLVTALENPTLSKKDRLSILLAILDGKPGTYMKQILEFVNAKERTSSLRMIALSYMDLYCEKKNIDTVQLITATEPLQSTIDKMKQLVNKIKPGEIDFETEVDPEIEGGFILFIDTYRLDASVRSQLNSIKKNLIAENSKL